MRSRYTLECKLADREYLDGFVRKIDSSQTLQRLLSQSPNTRTSEAAAARNRRNSADHHVPGSPRHLIERLMFEGLRISAGISSSPSPSASSPSPPAASSSSSSPPQQQHTPPAAPGPDGAALDVLAIAQDVVDERASLCVIFAAKMTDAAALNLTSAREVAYFLSQTRGEDRFLVVDKQGVPMETGRTRDVQLRFASPAFLSPALSITVGPTSSSFNASATASASGVTTARARAVDESTSGAGGRQEPSASAQFPRGPDAMSRALGDLLSSIFGFGDRDSRRGKEGGQVGEGSGSSGTSSGTSDSSDSGTSIDRGVPAPAVASASPRAAGAVATSASESVSAPVALDEQDGGDIPSFLRLGPEASIRLVAEKEENGRKFLLLEGKSVPADGRVRVLRQWVTYDDAVAFLGGGFSGQLWEKKSGDEEDKKEEDDGPFYGGEVTMM